MASKSVKRVLVLYAYAVLFHECGHCFIRAAESPPVMNEALISRLKCPHCDIKPECIECSKPYKADDNACNSCRRFWDFQAWAAFAAKKKAGHVRCIYNSIEVPGERNEENKPILVENGDFEVTAVAHPDESIEDVHEELKEAESSPFAPRAPLAFM
ncbi:hypothetical protein F5X99DRAFT_367376 [Biscogniauxia marginata]|nr:hypothetical protein F5X99DRAFT_367376 [Biscogniauxia marginata]